MKLIHKIKAAILRRRIVRRRVDHIRAIRNHREAIISLKIELRREMRLAGNLDRPQKIQKNTCRTFSSRPRVMVAEGKTNPRISALFAKCPNLERRAA
jgi:hypothetical protein